MKNSIKKKDVLLNFTKILIFERGDNLRNKNLVALESNVGEILGTNPCFIKYFEKEKVYLYKISYHQGTLDILIEEQILDKDIMDFFKAQLILQENNECN